MNTRFAGFLAVSWVALGFMSASAADPPAVIRIAADELEDKIRGGMLAQIIGNLNGLPHEFKYIDKPGELQSYTPALPDGAVTDDDTDIEWVYVSEIARSGRSLLPPAMIAELWKRHINRRIFCANHYARQLMDLGLEPPWTGNAALNPWSQFNISGQFLCESFGLMAPAMPQTAAGIGLQYTRTAIDGEPAQTTQFFTTMIALAFVETRAERLLDLGLEAVDPQSRVASVVQQVREVCRQHPGDWRAARSEIKRRWQTHGGELRDRNGYELNTACTVAALIYGKQDLVETLRIAFNLGWDCDNNAATAATIVGVWKGRRWMAAQQWDIADVYRNTTRDDMPMDETITGIEDKIIACARIVIAEHGGEIVEDDGRTTYQIRPEPPANIAALATAQNQTAHVRAALMPQMSDDLSGSAQARARAAYVAIALGEAETLERELPEQWDAALAALEGYGNVLGALFKAPLPSAKHLQEQASQAGLSPPDG